MVLVERHLVNVSEYTPVDEVRYEAGKSGNTITLNLFKRHVDMLRSDLLRGIVKRLGKVARSTFRSLALRCANQTCISDSFFHCGKCFGRKIV